MLDRTWITEDTEILTSIGWIEVKNVKYLDNILVCTDLIQKGKLLEFNTREYEGELPLYEDCKQGAFLKVDNKSKWSKEVRIKSKKYYKGKLYNIVLDEDNFFIKTNTNYILVRCLAQ